MLMLKEGRFLKRPCGDLEIAGPWSVLPSGQNNEDGPFWNLARIRRLLFLALRSR